LGSVRRYVQQGVERTVIATVTLPEAQFVSGAWQMFQPVVVCPDVQVLHHAQAVLDGVQVDSVPGAEPLQGVVDRPMDEVLLSRAVEDVGVPEVVGGNGCSFLAHLVEDDVVLFSASGSMTLA
jgi:hypothetical protein